MKTPRNSHHLHLQVKQSSSSRCENPCTSISQLLADVGLDQELIIEILLRLPVKSLSKFKCVSKSWFSLISSPQFIKSHFSASESKAKADQYVNSQVFFTELSPTIGLRQFSLYSALYEPSANVSDIELPFQKPEQHFRIIGMVNGLVCLVGGDDMFLWNPVLRKSKHFLLPNFSQIESGSKYSVECFGYDESNDGYKVVFVETKDVTKVIFYSLLTDSWRRIEDLKPAVPLQGHGNYANGKMHWLASSSVHERKIVSLDMVGEKYGELQCPDYETGMSGGLLGVLRGHLSMLCDYDLKKGDLWVMDRYGVDESWSKVVSIPYVNVHHDTIFFLPQVICILRNGIVVLSTGWDSLLVYHSGHKEFRNIALGGSNHYNFRVYVESLVSPACIGLTENSAMF